MRTLSLPIWNSFSRRQAGDRSGLIYGMGHALHPVRPPAVLLKRFARRVAEKKDMLDEFELFETVERLAPEVFHRVTGQDKVMCANVDLYSGLVYKMMGIPPELYTPLFAIARIVGWCAHRGGRGLQPYGKILAQLIRPSPQSQAFIPLTQRE